jgi:hypothetical protein
MKDNLDPLSAFFGELDKAGIKTTMTEGTSAFGGLSYFSIKDLRKDNLAPDKSVAGQNDFEWWEGHEDMLYDICAHVDFRKRTLSDIRNIYFRTLAGRGYITPIGDLLDDQHRMPDWLSHLNQTYLHALPHMNKREILPDDQGICWNYGNTSIFWCFRDFTADIPGTAKIEQLDGKTAIDQPPESASKFRGHHVYRVRQ